MSAELATRVATRRSSAGGGVAADERRVTGAEHDGLRSPAGAPSRCRSRRRVTSIPPSVRWLTGIVKAGMHGKAGADGGVSSSGWA
jgi:hypothetical protein